MSFTGRKIPPPRDIETLKYDEQGNYRGGNVDDLTLEELVIEVQKRLNLLNMEFPAGREQAFAHANNTNPTVIKYGGPF